MRWSQFLVVLIILMAVSALSVPYPPVVAASDAGADGAIAAELIGQVANPAPNRTLAYGYLSYINGLAPEQLVAGGDFTERTARFSFFVDTVNQRVVTNGPLRIIDRVGTLGLYLDSAPNGDWSRPEGFHDGEQILAAELRYQVVINTLTGAFSASWDVSNGWSRRFALGDTEYQLGQSGERFTMTFVGQLNAQAPPTAHIAGFARGIALQH